jgi:hypothetical protein
MPRKRWNRQNDQVAEEEEEEICDKVEETKGVKAAAHKAAQVCGSVVKRWRWRRGAKGWRCCHGPVLA